MAANGWPLPKLTWAEGTPTEDRSPVDTAVPPIPPELPSTRDAADVTAALFGWVIRHAIWESAFTNLALSIR